MKTRASERACSARGASCIAQQLILDTTLDTAAPVRPDFLGPGGSRSSWERHVTGIAGGCLIRALQRPAPATLQGMGGGAARARAAAGALGTSIDQALSAGSRSVSIQHECVAGLALEAVAGLVACTGGGEMGARVSGRFCGGWRPQWSPRASCQQMPCTEDLGHRGIGSALPDGTPHTAHPPLSLANSPLHRTQLSPKRPGTSHGVQAPLSCLAQPGQHSAQAPAPAAQRMQPRSRAHASSSTQLALAATDPAWWEAQRAGVSTWCESQWAQILRIAGVRRRAGRAPRRRVLAAPTPQRAACGVCPHLRRPPAPRRAGMHACRAGGGGRGDLLRGRPSPCRQPRAAWRAERREEWRAGGNAQPTIGCVRLPRVENLRYACMCFLPPPTGQVGFRPPRA